MSELEVEVRSYTASGGGPGVVVGITPQVGRELCAGQRVLHVPLQPAWPGFVGMGPVIELRAKDFDVLAIAEPVFREIEACQPLWSAFEVKLCQVPDLDDLSYFCVNRCCSWENPSALCGGSGNSSATRYPRSSALRYIRSGE